MATRIRGIEGMKGGEIDFELQRGAKFVFFQYCISIIVVTFRRASDIYFLRPGESAVTKGLPFIAAFAGSGLVGHPLGADLYHPVGLQQFARRQGRHRGRHPFSARARGRAGGNFPRSSKERLGVDGDEAR